MTIPIGWGVAPAAAQERDLAPTPEQVLDRNEALDALTDALWTQLRRLRVDFENRLVSSGEFDGARARWYRTGLTVEGGVPISDRASFIVSPSFAFERLDFDGSDEFTISQSGRASNPNEFLDASLRVGGGYRFDYGLGLELVTSANLRQEVGAAFTESLRVGGSLAGVYRRGRWLRLRLGLGLGTDVADGKLRFSPVYRIQIRPHERLTLESGGLNGALVWEASPLLELTLAGGLDSAQYRLDRRKRPPTGLGSGTLQRRQGSVGVAATFRFRDWLRLRGDLGVVLREELSVLDDDGEEVDVREENDPSVVLGLRIELRQ